MILEITDLSHGITEIIHGVMKIIHGAALKFSRKFRSRDVR